MCIFSIIEDHSLYEIGYAPSYSHLIGKMVID